MIEETFVFVEGFIKESFRNKEEMDFKLDNMMLLDEVIDRFTKEVKVQIDIHKLDDTVGNEFIKVVKNNRGKCKLRVYFTDGEQSVQMKSNKYSVNANDFIEIVKNWDFMELKLN